MDLDPFEPVGIAASTMRFIDIFLLHCLLSESPPDTPAEIAALGRNQQATATRGREPGLMLERGGAPVLLTAWGAELIDQMLPIAESLDALDGGSAYRDAWQAGQATLADLASAPSARVLAAMAAEADSSFVAFTRAKSTATRAGLLALPFGAELQSRFEAWTGTSLEEQKRIEANDSLPFEIYRQQYLSADRLGKRTPPHNQPAAPTPDRRVANRRGSARA